MALGRNQVRSGGGFQPCLPWRRRDSPSLLRLCCQRCGADSIRSCRFANVFFINRSNMPGKLWAARLAGTGLELPGLRSPAEEVEQFVLVGPGRERLGGLG